MAMTTGTLGVGDRDRSLPPMLKSKIKNKF